MKNLQEGRSRLFVTYEDRLKVLDGLKLLCLSFQEHCPNEKLTVFLPLMPCDLTNWVAKNLNSNFFFEIFNSSVSGWSLKAEILLSQLERNLDEVIWLDSDLIIVNPFDSMISSYDQKIMILADCPGAPDEQRATYWNLKVSRKFERLINTSFIRITPCHKDILEAWKALIYSVEFQNQQKKNFGDRSVYAFGDQDLLEGLLMSENFSDIPVSFIQHSRQIIHASSLYGLKSRLKIVIGSLFKVNSLMIIHAHGLKPWVLRYRKASSLNLSDVLVELSPYNKTALLYQDKLDSDVSWMQPRTLLGRLSNAVFFSNPHLRGIPVIFLQKIFNLFKLN